MASRYDFYKNFFVVLKQILDEIIRGFFVLFIVPLRREKVIIKSLIFRLKCVLIELLSNHSRPLFIIGSITHLIANYVGFKVFVLKLSCLVYLTKP